MLLLPVVIALGAWIAWPRADGPGRLYRDGEQEQADGGRNALLADEGGIDAVDPMLEGRPSESVEPQEAGEDRDAFEEGCVLRGTLVLVEQDGREVAVTEGKLEFLTTDSCGGFSTQTAEVREGRWLTTVPNGEKVLPFSAEIGGRIAFFPDHFEPRSVTEGLTLSYRARFPLRTVLRVVDARTQVDLDDVTLVRVGNVRRGDTVHPGDYSPKCVIAEGVASPLEVPPGEVGGFDKGVVFHVYSPGFAWGRIEFDLTTGGERILSLRPGGSVRARLTGQPASKDMVLRMRPAKEEPEEDGRVVVELPLGGSNPLDVVGLPPGAYRLTAEIGAWFVRPKLIAKTPCEVVAGRRTEAVLELPVLAVPQEVPLAGDVNLPPSWELRRLDLRLQGLDMPVVAMETRRRWSTAAGLRLVQERGGVWTFDAGLVPPGRYQVLVVGTGYWMEFQIGASGNRNVHVEVPPPVPVSVRPVNAVTGKDASVDRIHWQFEFPSCASEWFSQDVYRDKESGRFEFRAPSGRISISVIPQDYVAEDLHVQVVPGLKEQTFIVHPTGSILIVLKDGTATVPTWEVWDAKVTQIDGDGQVVEAGDGEIGARFWLDKPGRYRIELPPIPDYEAVPPREVRVKTGKVTKVEIDLTRIR